VGGNCVVGVGNWFMCAGVDVVEDLVYIVDDDVSQNSYILVYFD